MTSLLPPTSPLIMRYNFGVIQSREDLTKVCRKKYQPRKSSATSASSSTISSSDNVDSIDGESIEESLLDAWDE